MRGTDATGAGLRAEAAQAIARKAGAAALALFRQRDSLVIEAKANPQDVVSRADREVETLIRDEVARAFPQDGFLGEEYGETAGSSGFTWVIDPIDGTSPFLHGMPYWCVSIAVAQGSEAVAAAICDPNAGEVFAGTAGGGATLNGVPLRLDPALTLATGLVGVGASHRTPPEPVGRFIATLIAEGGMYFRHGSGALMLAAVSAGRLAAYWEPHMHPWDCMAGLLLVREAGGWTRDYPGPGPLAQGGAVAAAGPGAAEDLRALMTRLGV
ncbi:MAG: inositol monophosphatase [Alphaproteobacteria bacterium]|nr:MAG: inositol monophosphatase [Alphaproteobacteria bacterium]